jgi:hypothetical protein
MDKAIVFGVNDHEKYPLMNRSVAWHCADFRLALTPMALHAAMPLGVLPLWAYGHWPALGRRTAVPGFLAGRCYYLRTNRFKMFLLFL